MFSRGRHDRHRKSHDAAKRRQQKGMARVALKARYTGKPVTDSYGYPLKAMELANGHGMGTLEKIAFDRTGYSVTMAVDGSNPKAATWP